MNSTFINPFTHDIAIIEKMVNIQSACLNIKDLFTVKYIFT